MVLLDFSLTDPEELSTTKENSESYLCIVCGALITEEKYLIGISGNTPFHVFTNPYGLVFNIMTVAHAEMLIPVSQEETEYTWFPGYSWRIEVCSVCREHLGWYYHSGRNKPSQFYGLIRDKLVSGH